MGGGIPEGGLAPEAGALGTRVAEEVVVARGHGDLGITYDGGDEVSRRFRTWKRDGFAYHRDRMASSKGMRVFGMVILVACIAVIGGGGWYFFGRDLFEGADDVASDDEPDELVIDRDGGAHRIHHASHATHHGKRTSGHHKPSHAAPPPVSYGPAGKSYEAAVAGNQEQVSIGGTGAVPNLTDAQLAGPMRNGTFLGVCGTPDSMHVTVKVAIRGGRAVGVSVYTNPPNGQIAGCVDRQVRNLAWPVNAKMDSFVTVY